MLCTVALTWDHSCRVIKFSPSPCVQGMAELERCHQEQQTGMQGELKKEVALLQKKLLMESVS